VLPLSIMGAITGFNNTFAVRLGADKEQLGYLTSFQAMIAMFFRLPFARFLEGRAKPLRWMWGALLTVRLMYLGPALLPLLFPESAGAVMVIWLILLQVPAVLFQAGWNPLLVSLIAMKDRARILANRNIIQSIIIFFASSFFGLLLEARSDIFPANFQWLYVAGVCMILINFFQRSKLAIPENFLTSQAKPSEDAAPEIDNSLRAVIAEVRGNKNFLTLLIDTLAYQGGVWLLISLFPIYFVEELGASDGWIGARLAVMRVGTIAGYALWSRIMERRGFTWTMKRALPFGAVFSIVSGLFPDLTIIMLASAFHQFIIPGFGLSRQNILFKISPAERRPTYLGLFNTTMSIGRTVLPLIGVAISNVIGIRATLVLGGSLRLVGMAMYYLKPVKEPEQDLSIARPG
jgi:Na+/melibiose symporter-like transporter